MSEVSEVLKEVSANLGIVYEILGSEKMANSIAKMYKNIFTALQKEGFSKREALTLLTRMNLGQSK